MLLIDNDFKAVEYVKYAIEETIDDFSGGSKDKLGNQNNFTQNLCTGNSFFCR